MFHALDNVMYLFDCQNIYISMCCMFFYSFHYFLLYHEFVFWTGGLTLHNKQYLIL